MAHNETALVESKDFNVPPHRYGNDVESVLISEENLQARIQELADKVSKDYADTEEDLLLICVLKGAVYFLTDFARALSIPSQIEFMAVSSYGNSTSSSGVVRILKDLDREIENRDVLIVEDIIDSGLTLKWLQQNLVSRGANSVEICTLLRKPKSVKTDVEVKYVGWDIEPEFVVGYGLDFAERYRNLDCIVTLAPHVYS